MRSPRLYLVHGGEGERGSSRGGQGASGYGYVYEPAEPQQRESHGEGRQQPQVPCRFRRRVKALQGVRDQPKNRLILGF